MNSSGFLFSRHNQLSVQHKNQQAHVTHRVQTNRRSWTSLARNSVLAPLSYRVCERQRSLNLKDQQHKSRTASLDSMRFTGSAHWFGFRHTETNRTCGHILHFLFLAECCKSYKIILLWLDVWSHIFQRLAVKLLPPLSLVLILIRL